MLEQSFVMDMYVLRSPSMSTSERYCLLEMVKLRRAAIHTLVSGLSAVPQHCLTGGCIWHALQE
jgi:hypothetical protein